MKSNDAGSILRYWREAVPHDRLAHLVRDTARGLDKALAVRLAAHGVLFGHWVFLRILWNEDGLTQRELAARAGLSEPTAFTALKAMARLGHIRRIHQPGNQRKIYAFLTPQGRALEAVLVPLAEEVNAIAVQGSQAEEIASLRRTLLRIIENLANDETSRD